MDAQAEAKRASNALILRGVAAILFGFAAVFWPKLTLVTLVYLFSAFVLVNGLINIVEGFGNISRRNEAMSIRVLVIVLGILEVGVGIYLLRHPSVTFATLVLLIGFILIIRGVVGVITGLFRGSTSATSRTVMVISGLLAALAGVVVLFQPATAGVAFVWILGVFALISGPLEIAVALDVSHESSAAARRR